MRYTQTNITPETAIFSMFTVLVVLDVYQRTEFVTVSVYQQQSFALHAIQQDDTGLGIQFTESEEYAFPGKQMAK